MFRLQFIVRWSSENQEKIVYQVLYVDGFAVRPLAWKGAMAVSRNTIWFRDIQIFHSTAMKSLTPWLMRSLTFSNDFQSQIQCVPRYR